MWMEAEDLVAGPQALHVGADDLDSARDVDACDPGPRPGQTDAAMMRAMRGSPRDVCQS